MAVQGRTALTLQQLAPHPAIVAAGGGGAVHGLKGGTQVFLPAGTCGRMADEARPYSAGATRAARRAEAQAAKDVPSWHAAASQHGPGRSSAARPDHHSLQLPDGCRALLGLAGIAAAETVDRGAACLISH